MILHFFSDDVIASDCRCEQGRYFSNCGGHSNHSKDSSQSSTSVATEEAVVLIATEI